MRDSLTGWVASQAGGALGEIGVGVGEAPEEGVGAGHVAVLGGEEVEREARRRRAPGRARSRGSRAPRPAPGPRPRRRPRRRPRASRRRGSSPRPIARRWSRAAKWPSSWPSTKASSFSLSATSSRPRVTAMVPPGSAKAFELRLVEHHQAERVGVLGPACARGARAGCARARRGALAGAAPRSDVAPERAEQARLEAGGSQRATTSVAANAEHREHQPRDGGRDASSQLASASGCVGETLTSSRGSLRVEAHGSRSLRAVPQASTSTPAVPALARRRGDLRGLEAHADHRAVARRVGALLHAQHRLAPRPVEERLVGGDAPAEEQPQPGDEALEVVEGDHAAPADEGAVLHPPGRRARRGAC